MAKDKKSFLLYVDLIHTVEKLPNEKAGELFKLILNYVNDNNPTTDDLLLNIAFEPIKQQLKRDLKRYESIVESRKKAGLASAESKKQNQQVLTSVDFVQQTSTNSTDKDNDIDTDNVNDTENEINNNTFNFKKSLIDLGIEKQIVSDWLKVRAKKRAVNSETAFNAIKSQIEKSTLTANECIKKAVEKSWAGFDCNWLNKEEIKEQSQQAKPKFTVTAKNGTRMVFYVDTLDEAKKLYAKETGAIIEDIYDVYARN